MPQKKLVLERKKIREKRPKSAGATHSLRAMCRLQSARSAHPPRHICQHCRAAPLTSPDAAFLAALSCGQHCAAAGGGGVSGAPVARSGAAAPTYCRRPHVTPIIGPFASGDTAVTRLLGQRTGDGGGGGVGGDVPWQG